MKKFICVLLFLGSPVAYADLSHTISHSVKLTVGGAMTSSDRIPTSYSVSGNGVDTTYTSGGSAVTDGIGSLTISSGVGAIPSIEVTQKTAGNSFSFSQSFNQGDAISGSAPTVGEVPNYSDITSTAAGTPSNLAGTITSAGAITVTAGGANTEAVGQVVSTLLVQ